VCGRLPLREENEFAEKLADRKLVFSISVNRSGFGRDLSRWVGKQTVLPSNAISVALVGKNKGHPSVFPVDMPEFFIRLLCPPDGFVADPFAVQAPPESRHLHLVGDVC